MERAFREHDIKSPYVLICIMPEYIQDLVYTKDDGTIIVLTKGEKRLINPFQDFYVDKSAQRTIVTDG